MLLSWPWRYEIPWIRVWEEVTVWAEGERPVRVVERGLEVATLPGVHLDVEAFQIRAWASVGAVVETSFPWSLSAFQAAVAAPILDLAAALSGRSERLEERARAPTSEGKAPDLLSLDQEIEAEGEIWVSDKRVGTQLEVEEFQVRDWALVGAVDEISFPWSLLAFQEAVEAPILDLAVPALARSERLLEDWSTADEAKVEAEPRPKLVRAVEGLAKSERLLEEARAPRSEGRAPDLLILDQAMAAVEETWVSAIPVEGI